MNYKTSIIDNAFYNSTVYNRKSNKMHMEKEKKISAKIAGY